MKKKQHILGIVFLIYSIVFPLFQTYEVLANTTDTTKTSLLQTDKVAVTYSLNKVSNQQNLNLLISYDTKSATTKDKVKFRFTTADNQVLSFEQKSGWKKDTSNNTEWYVQDQFKQTTNETLTLPLPTTINQLKIEIQLDEETTETTPATVKNNILEVKQQGPYTITIPTVAATETTSSQATTSSSATSNTTSSQTTTSSNQTSTTSKTEEIKSSESISTTTTQSEAKTSGTTSSGTLSTTQSSTPAMAARTFNAIDTQDARTYNQYNESSYFDKQNTSQWTNQYLGGASPFVKNYAFGANLKGTSPYVGVNNILGQAKDGTNTAFNNGYHEFQINVNNTNLSVLTKKTVKPTDNPNEFEIQLDAIGQMLQNRKNLDIVLVLDKSGSMNDILSGQTDSKWTQLQSAVKKFSNEILSSNTAGQNRLGIASFQTQSIYYNHYPQISSAKFANKTAFTTSSTDLLSTDIYTSNPNGGTPTFLGVDAGIQLLTDSTFGSRTDAEKVLIVLTDGKPTYYPKQNNILSTGKYATLFKDASVSKTSSNVSGTLTDKDRYDGDGANTYTYTLQDNASYIENLYDPIPNISKYAIDLGGNNTVDFMNTLGPSGRYSTNDIDKVFDQITSKVLSNNFAIKNGQLFDSMSSDVTLISSPVLSGITLSTKGSISSNKDVYMDNIEKNSTDKQIKLNKVDLGSDINGNRHGIRLTYKVRLNNTDGNFHELNQPTYLTTEQSSTPIGFAVPSARYQTRTITASSVDGNKAAVNGATYVLERKKADGTWETIETKTAPSNTNTVTFKTVAARDTSGNEFTYRVTQNKVGNYALPEKQTVIPLKDWLSDKQTVEFKNPALQAEIKFTKINELQTPMAGVSFTLSGNGITAITKETDKNGLISFGNYPIGKYTLKETKTNAGYQLLPEKTIEIVENNGKAEVKLDGQPLDKIQNTLLATNLVFETFDYNDKKTVLDGKYTVKDSTGKTVTDSSNLMPGRYQFNQTQTSPAYQLLKDTIYFEITKDGQIREIDQSGNPVTTKDSQVTFTYTLATDGKSKNQLKITVLNLKKGQLPETGGFGHFFTNRLAVIFASLGFLVALLYVGLQVRGRKR